MESAVGRSVGRRSPVVRGCVGGIAGAVPAGAILSAVAPGTITQAIPAAVGLSGSLAGWLLVTGLGAAFGVVFAVVVAWLPGIHRMTDRLLLGTAYGITLWFGLEHALSATRASVETAPPPVPSLDPFRLAVILVYGVTLAAVTWSLE